MLSFIMLAMERNMLSKAGRMLCSFADGAVYYFVAAIFQAIFDISRIPFEKTILDSLTSKLYVILSIFMFFKISISLIAYLVNPDSIVDKNQGVGKLISKVVITLIILLMFPTVFNELTDQTLNEGILDTLPKLIIGTTFDDGGNKGTKMESRGKNIAWTVLSGFIQNNMDCPNNTTTEIDFENFIGERSIVYSAGPKANQVKPNVTAVLENINTACESNADEYQYEYTPIISTLAGGFLLFILVGIAINVGVRMFKLMILRIIAPIPIVSYMDPKSGKDGPFNKWLKSILTVWGELYLHLAVVYFVVFLIQKIINSKVSETMTTINALGPERGIYVKIFIILALFFFAKQAPKFIASAIGLPNSDSFKGIMDMAKGGLSLPASVAAGAAGGLVAGRGLSGMASGAINGLNNGLHKAKVADSLKQGLDLGTKIRTGGEETKYKGLLQRAQEGISRSAAAGKMGYDSVGQVNKAYDKFKQEKMDAENRYAEALTAYQNGTSYDLVDSHGGHHIYSGENLNKLIYGKGGLKETAGKAESRFNDFSSHVGAFGMGGKRDSSLKKANTSRNFFDTNGSRVAYGAFTEDSASQQAPAAPSSSGGGDPAMDAFMDAQIQNNEERMDAAYMNGDYDANSYNDEYMAGSGDNVFTRSEAPELDYEAPYQQQYSDGDDN